ncbi:AurF N-oxygenase family protein [Nocardia thailandica]
MGNNAVSARDAFSRRLLAGSVRRSYEPAVDLDWDAPLDPDGYFLPPEVVSLHGTAIWDALPPATRRELSRQELANILSVGIWFENLLERLLLRELLHGDPTSPTAHYVLTEMGDECRHMLMFGKLIERIEARPYWPRPAGRLAISALPLVLRGNMVWVAALVGEEIFDAVQRRILDDPQLQLIVARAMRIHVTEEARHIGFARDALARRVSHISAAERAYIRLCVAAAGPLFAALITNRHAYDRAGLDGRACRRAALANPDARRVRAQGAAELTAFLDRNGLFGPIGKRLWRRVGLA